MQRLMLQHILINTTMQPWNFKQSICYLMKLQLCVLQIT